MSQRTPPGGPPGQPEPAGQPMGAGQAGAQPAAQPESIPELSVSTPTLRWITLAHPQDHVPLGEEDYVLQSVFNHQYNTWEVLVLLQPREAEDEEDEE